MSTSLYKLTAAMFVALMTLSAPAAATDVQYGSKIPKGARAGDLSMAPCSVYLSVDDRSFPGECGTLVVPENRQNPESRLIALPVTRVKATGADTLEPIFTLSGGPGSSNATFRHPTDGLLQRHDFVMVGYRGNDGQVSLDCPEVADAIRATDSSYLSDAALASYGRASAACARRLRAEGIDLDGYSMNQTVDDLEAARIALGYTRINLLGRSYGTRLEIIYQWRYPDSLHRVVMLSVNPPGHFVWYPHLIDQQLGQYAALCAKDAHCSKRTSDLSATLRAVAHAMPTSWLGIPIHADAVKMITFAALMNTMHAPDALLPMSGPAVIDMWLDAAEGDASGMALMSLLATVMLPNLEDVWGHFFAMGLSAPDFLGSERDFRAELMPPDAILGSPVSLFFSGMVPGWPASSDQQRYTEVPDTSVETLLISGSIDFSTPMEAARDKLLPHLKNGHQVIVREIGHTTSFWYNQPEAQKRLLNRFFDSGVVDTSLYQYNPPVFAVEKSWSSLAKLLIGTAVLVLVAVLLLLAVIVRKLRRMAAARRAD